MFQNRSTLILNN